MNSESLRLMGAAVCAASALPFLACLRSAWCDDDPSATRRYRLGLAILSVGSALLIGTLWAVGIEVGHAPFQTIHEVMLYGALCTTLAYLVISASNRLHAAPRGPMAVGASLGASVGLFTAIVVGPVATSYGYDRLDLPPALQSSFFVPHVVVYLFGYGAAAVATLAAALYLAVALSPLANRAWAPAALRELDDLSYRTVALAFPFLTFGLAMGTAWAWYAWSNYWGWDNKEVWALITWLTFLVYLHLRLVAGMRGTRASWFLVLGGTCVWITLLLFGYLPASAFSAHKYSM